MVLANSLIAKHVALKLKEKTSLNLAIPFRIHEKPSDEKLNDFRKFLSALGVEFSLKKKISSKVFQRLQNAIKGTDRQVLIEDVMIRSMMKAKYSTKNKGHFGLALKYYCHFTSPIRRYPDLLLHCLLKQYIKNPNQIPIIKASKLEQICEHATEMEIKAMEAERASTKAKQLEYMLDKIGQTFPGIISGVTSFGIFVEIIDLLIEGLVHISSLGDDYYIYDETRYLLKGTYQGKSYQLGDYVTVRVVLVNPQEKIIDFELVVADRAPRN
jgi:ribonuclease R